MMFALKRGNIAVGKRGIIFEGNDAFVSKNRQVISGAQAV